MITDDIKQRLYEMRDEKYRDFQSRLIPNVNKETMIGVRTPDLRTLAKVFSKEPDIGVFLDALPHGTFDENQLHAFIISLGKDFSETVPAVEKFLPYVDNWATCDQLSPKVFSKHKTELLGHIRNWLVSEKTYTVRFAVGMLMQHFLDWDFSEEYPRMVADISSDEYYINMMRAWYFATALAKQYDAVIPYIEEHILDKWTHNKSIVKAVESRRITPEQKIYLKTLKR